MKEVWPKAAMDCCCCSLFPYRQTHSCPARASAPRQLHSSRRCGANQPQLHRSENKRFLSLLLLSSLTLISSLPPPLLGFCLLPSPAPPPHLRRCLLLGSSKSHFSPVTQISSRSVYFSNDFSSGCASPPVPRGVGLQGGSAVRQAVPAPRMPGEAPPPLHTTLRL